VDSALANDPAHRGAQALDKKLKKLEYLEACPRRRPNQRPRSRRTKSIEQINDEARHGYMLKDYDRASALFEQISHADPYHRKRLAQPAEDRSRQVSSWPPMTRLPACRA
jgi:hypothetical protein